MVYSVCPISSLLLVITSPDWLPVSNGLPFLWVCLCIRRFTCLFCDLKFNLLLKRLCELRSSCEPVSIKLAIWYDDIKLSNN